MNFEIQFFQRILDSGFWNSVFQRILDFENQCTLNFGFRNSIFLAYTGFWILKFNFFIVHHISKFNFFSVYQIYKICLCNFVDFRNSVVFLVGWTQFQNGVCKCLDLIKFISKWFVVECVGNNPSVSQKVPHWIE